jgi:NAD(P)-dependent dehydrogenase (short-subunit alcohol dehydrogenase family)
MPTPERFAIKPGQRVLVTAGAAGIGHAIASTFFRAGARVHICDISQGVLDECLTASPDISGTLADVSDEHDVARLFAEVDRQLSGLDVLVNNAGIAGPTGGIHEISPADWRRTIDVNLTGQFYCARLAVPMLRKASDGAIINMASVAGRLGYAFRTPYAAAKWGIIGLTESLAKELGPEGIRVNAILPGIVAGPRMTRVIQARADAAQVDYATMESEFLGKVSLRRMVTAQDVADMVLFLCSPAGRNISGQSLSVCGNVETL